MKYFIYSVLIFLLITCTDPSQNEIDSLSNYLTEDIKNIDGDVALAFIDLSDNKTQILINVDEKFHAASTMKVPVMIGIYNQITENKFQINDSILLKNEFKSIVDGSSFKMDINRDGDDDLYSHIGKKVTIYHLMYHMITLSSNIATNILIELVGASNVTKSMRVLGAQNIEVLRGVEDLKAFDKGLSNSTTARDLMIVMKAIATNLASSKDNRQEMIHLLKDQQFNSIIPLYLPKNTIVAHKTGAITGVHHDMAIVYLPNGNSYILVVMSKNLKYFEFGTNQLAKLSKKKFIRSCFKSKLLEILINYLDASIRGIKLSLL